MEIVFYIMSFVAFVILPIYGIIKLQKIEIPIIQRDYAQGRKNDEVNRIRELFLDAIFHSITDKKPITLDFVYGDVSAEGVLTPLDGQQRLTTLFLLYWYIAKKERIDIGEYKFSRIGTKFCLSFIGQFNGSTVDDFP